MGLRFVESGSLTGVVLFMFLWTAFWLGGVAGAADASETEADAQKQLAELEGLSDQVEENVRRNASDNPFGEAVVSFASTAGEAGSKAAIAGYDIGRSHPGIMKNAAPIAPFFGFAGVVGFAVWRIKRVF